NEEGRQAEKYPSDHPSGLTGSDLPPPCHEYRPSESGQPSDSTLPKCIPKPNQIDPTSIRSQAFARCAGERSSVSPLNRPHADSPPEKKKEKRGGPARGTPRCHMPHRARRISLI